MRTSSLFFGLFLLLVFCGFTAYAQEESAQASKESRVFENSEQAKAALQIKLDEISEILGKDGGIQDTDLEEIHEKSSVLKSAVDKFRADKTYNEAKLNELDESVHALRLASQNHDLTKTHDWFLKIKSAVGNLDAPPNGAASVQ